MNRDEVIEQLLDQYREQLKKRTTRSCWEPHSDKMRENAIEANQGRSSALACRCRGGDSHTRKGWLEARQTSERRLPVKATAEEEVTEAIRNCQNHDRLQWDGPNKVKLLTTKLFPEGSGYPQDGGGATETVSVLCGSGPDRQWLETVGQRLLERSRKRAGS